MRIRSLAFALAAVLLAPLTAHAQFSDPAPGEDFVVELGLMFWKPSPEISIQTGSLVDVLGEIDFVEEFDIADETFTEFRAVLKPGRRHKIRFSYTTMSYDETATLQRTFTFGGRTFTQSAQASAALEWTMLKLGYEFDIVARDRGFFGIIGELKHNKVSADISAAGIGAELYEATAPVPTIGVIGRGYPVRNVSITAEFTGFKLPDSISEEFEARLFDFDIYGNVSFNRHVGVQVGYRSVVADYLVDEDRGDLKMQGPYFGGVVRF